MKDTKSLRKQIAVEKQLQKSPKQSINEKAVNDIDFEDIFDNDKNSVKFNTNKIQGLLNDIENQNSKGLFDNFQKERGRYNVSDVINIGRIDVGNNDQSTSKFVSNSTNNRSQIHTQPADIQYDQPMQNDTIRWLA